MQAASFMSVRWEENINTHRSCPVSFYIPGEYAFIADRRKNAPDLVVHELRHNLMYNINDHIPSSPNCANHSINRASDAICAFGEGWAEFLPLLVNGDECYNCGLGPCGYNADWYFDLEFSTRDTPNFDYGDTVEVRVSAVFFDLFDAENESDLNNLQINLHPTTAPFCNLSINGAFLSGDFSAITQGHCEALIEVSDSLTSTWQLLVINIHPATNAIYFPAIQDNSFVK